MPSIHDYATWEPLLRLLHERSPEALTAPGGHAAGSIGRGGWSVPARPAGRRRGRALLADMENEQHAVDPVRRALAACGADDVHFVLERSSAGEFAFHVLDHGPAVESGPGAPYPGSLVLVEDALPEPWRRLPEPVPGAVPAPSADPALLERTLRERLPGAVGAAEAEIAAAEARLGIALPEELRAVYRAVRARREDRGDGLEAAERVFDAVGCELFPLDRLYVADAPSRPRPWRFAAQEAVVTPPGAAVQGLVGSPGWIVFGDSGGGDRIAVDLTPGPRGHTGQVIVIGHEDGIGADLLAESLTGLVLNRPEGARRGHRAGPPAKARVDARALPGIEAAARPELEVLGIGVRDGEPLGLGPVAGLPRLRTLTACPGTLADPLEVAGLAGLEFLELGPEEWRALLGAGAVPRGLSAASIAVQGRDRNPLEVAALANEILALWDRPPITRTGLDGAPGRAG
ncbi:SMI1/KNR4 family protein [Nocardiopsis sp. CNT-189]|uniref:SMI1/KNR4 family protein n=1 Tax=Nocardiopsis oceanisediminis TaxID=2816862 RepID=UPI003B2E3D02